LSIVFPHSAIICRRCSKFVIHTSGSSFLALENVGETCNKLKTLRILESRKLKRRSSRRIKVTKVLHEGGGISRLNWRGKKSVFKLYNAQEDVEIILCSLMKRKFDKQAVCHFSNHHS